MDNLVLLGFALLGLVLGIISHILNRSFGMRFGAIPFIVLTLLLIIADIIIVIQFSNADAWVGLAMIIIFAYPYMFTLLFLGVTWIILDKIFKK